MKKILPIICIVYLIVNYTAFSQGSMIPIYAHAITKPCVGEDIKYSFGGDARTIISWQVHGEEGDYQIVEGGGWRDSYVTVKWLRSFLYGGKVSLTTNEYPYYSEVEFMVFEYVTPRVNVFTIQESPCVGNTFGNIFKFLADPSFPGKAPTYEWYLDGKLVGQNTTTLEKKFHKAGNHQVSVKMTSSETCVSTNPVESEPVFFNLELCNAIAITPDKNTACPGERINFEVLGNIVVDDSYEIYESISKPGKKDLIYKLYQPTNEDYKNKSGFSIKLPDQYPVKATYFIRYQKGDKSYSANSKIINILSPGNIYIGSAPNQSVYKCLYFDEQTTIFADICSGMIENAGDWDFAWQYQDIGSEDWHTMGDFKDISKDFESLSRPNDFNYFTDHIYRIAFKRTSETAPKLFTNTVEIKYYPKFLNTFTFINRFCTELFTPVFYNEFNECPMRYEWDFADGSSISTVRKPIHKYEANGEYPVSFTVRYDCGCGEKSETVQVLTPHYEPMPIIDDYETDSYHIEKVIDANATTITDSWSLRFIDQTLSSENPFENGMKGVWRQDASYVYQTPRQYDDNKPYSEKGTYTLNMFNWHDAPLAIVPNWLKANQVTSYNQYGFETENRDILGIYSSSIYGHGGQLPLAVGYNMAETEMAFTSFETNVEIEDEDWLGHWTFGTSVPRISKEFIVVKGDHNLAKVDAPIEQVNKYSKFIVHAEGQTQLTNPIISLFVPIFLVTNPNPKYLNYKRTSIKTEANVLCTKSDIDENFTWVAFDDWLIPGYWTGKLYYYQDAISGSPLPINNTFAHTGNSSLEISGTSNFYEQSLLSLKAEKTYLISAWVSAGDKIYDTPSIGNNIGIELFAGQTDGQADFIFTPSGSIVDGWQQINGSFKMNVDATVYLRFSSGSEPTAYFDDIRVHPSEGNMKSYVYDLDSYRLVAELDENNFSTYYEYDKAGNLSVIKKENERGIATIQEAVTNNPRPMPER